MTPPLIGISTSVTVGTTTPERAYVNVAYFRAVQRAGGVPVLLPPGLGDAALAALWARLDGLVLTGGGDVDPAHFGQAPHPTLTDVSAARDALEMTLTRQALAGGRPLLAICRGMQVLNVARGGSLHQHIPAWLPDGTVAHAQTAPRAVATHAVKIDAPSRLAEVLGAVEVRVNSLHHQAIDRVGDGLRVVAVAPDDGVIEALEAVDPRGFVLGVQWHPEDLAPHDPAAANLFAALVRAAAGR